MNDPTIPSWNAKMVAANKAIQAKSDELTRQQKQRWQDTYLAQFEEIIEAEDELQRNWGSKEARDRLSDAQAKLHKVRTQKFQFKESATQSKWTRVDDRCTKEFFEYHAGQRRPVISFKMEIHCCPRNQRSRGMCSHSTKNFTQLTNKWRLIQQPDWIVCDL